MTVCNNDIELVVSNSVARTASRLSALQLPRLSQITPDQIAAVVHAMWPSMVGHIFNTALTTIAFWGAVPNIELIAWCVISCGIAGLSLARRSRANTGLRKAPSRRFFIHSVISSAALALPWTYLVLRYLGTLNQMEELVLVTVVVGMSAAGGILLAPIYPAALTYIGVILVPTIAKCLLFPPAPQYLILGWLAMSYSAFLIGVIGVTARLSVENSENRRQRDVASTAASEAKIMATSSLEQLNAMEVEKQVAERAAADRSLFLATMSHEIRTPINGVLGALDLIRDESLSDRGRHCVKMATDSGETLLGLINDILLFSKSENDRLYLDQNAFDLETLVETTKSVMINSIQKSSNAITFSVCSKVERPVIGDAPRLRQVLINLISNANKFTNDGNIALRIDSLRDDDDELTVRFSVTDTGIGIPKENHELIFNRFQTLDPSYTRRTDGTGLGLAICDKLVRAMGGEINIDSEVGRGSCFYFDLVFPYAAGQVCQPLDQPLNEAFGPGVGRSRINAGPASVHSACRGQSNQRLHDNPVPGRCRARGPSRRERPRRRRDGGCPGVRLDSHGYLDARNGRHRGNKGRAAMDWYIHHINTPAVDVKTTAAFLRNIAGMQDGVWTYPENAGELHHRDDTIAYFGSANRGLHVVKPIPTFARDNGLIHNPTVGGHVAITVSDIQGVMARLDEAGVVYSDAGTYAMAGVHQIYFFDPSMNVIEINAVVDNIGGAAPRPGEAHDIRVEDGGWYIHHVNLPSHDVPQSVAFYRDVIGLPESE